MKSTLRFMIFLSCAYLAVAAGNLGCAGGGQGGRTNSAVEVTKNSMVATLTGVDREARLVTMKSVDGALSTVLVGDGDVLGRMEVGDRVRVDRLAALTFQVLAPGQAFEEQVYASDALPKGVLFGRKIATRVRILSVADEGKRATFRCADGTVRTMDIGTKSTRSLVASLHPGDDVEVTCTEKLAIELLR